MWGKKTEGTPIKNLHDPIALLEDVDSLHHVDLDILAFEIFIHAMTTERNSTRIDLLEDRAKQYQLAEWDVETSRVETQNTSRGMEEQRQGLIWWATIPRLERWWMVSRWRGNNCHDSVTGHLGKSDSLNCSLKWQKELLLIHRSLKLFIPA